MSTIFNLIQNMNNLSLDGSRQDMIRDVFDMAQSIADAGNVESEVQSKNVSVQDETDGLDNFLNDLVDQSASSNNTLVLANDREAFLRNITQNMTSRINVVAEKVIEQSQALMLDHPYGDDPITNKTDVSEDYDDELYNQAEFQVFRTKELRKYFQFAQWTPYLAQFVQHESFKNFLHAHPYLCFIESKTSRDREIVQTVIASIFRWFAQMFYNLSVFYLMVIQYLVTVLFPGWVSFAINSFFYGFVIALTFARKYNNKSIIPYFNPIFSRLIGNNWTELSLRRLTKTTDNQLNEPLMYFGQQQFLTGLIWSMNLYVSPVQFWIHQPITVFLGTFYPQYLAEHSLVIYVLGMMHYYFQGFNSSMMNLCLIGYVLYHYFLSSGLSFTGKHLQLFSQNIMPMTFVGFVGSSLFWHPNVFSNNVGYVNLAEFWIPRVLAFVPQLMFYCQVDLNVDATRMSRLAMIVGYLCVIPMFYTGHWTLMFFIAGFVAISSFMTYTVLYQRGYIQMYEKEMSDRTATLTKMKKNIK